MKWLVICQDDFGSAVHFEIHYTIGLTILRREAARELELESVITADALFV